MNARTTWLAEKLRSVSQRRNHRAAAGIAFLLPGFAFIFVYMLYPLLYSFYLSFTSYNFAFDDAPTFIGPGNYTHMWEDSYFLDAFRNTAFFSVAFLPLILVLSLAIALLINKGLKGTNFFRTAVFLPVIIPLSLTGIIFQWVLNENYGLFNYLIRSVLHMPSWAHNWLTDERYAMWCIIFVSIWKFMGIEVILFIAGLQAIPNTIYEAARIDGANSWNVLLHITLPNLKESYVITGIWAIIQAVKVYEQPFIMTGGGPGTSTLVLYHYVWKNAFNMYEMGYASAIAYIMGIIIALLTCINFLLHRNRD